MADNHRVVALNLGTANIVAVQGLVDDAPQGKRTAVVEKIATMPTPTGAVRANGVYNPAAITEALRELWRRDGLQTKNVIVGLDSRRIQSGLKWIDHYHPEDLAYAAKAAWVNAQQILPSKVDAQTSTIHHYVLRERDIENKATGLTTKQILVLIIAVPTVEAQALANIVEDTGMELVGMDLTALGMLRAANTPTYDDRRVVHMLVDIGETFVTMVLHNNGNVRAIDTTSGSAGDSVSRAIGEELSRMSRDLGASTLDPTHIKRTLGEMVKSNAEDPVTKRALAATVHQADGVFRDMDTFVSGYIRRVNETPAITAPGSAPAHNNEERGLMAIMLTGGGSILYGLGHQLEQGFNIPVSQALVSNSFAMPDGARVPAFANGTSVVSAVGLLTADRKAV